MNPEVVESKEINEPGPLGLALPMDRLAATVLDFSLLVPVLQIIQAPFKKIILESLLFEQGRLAQQLESINGLLGLFLFAFYFTLTTYFGGQTLGQRFLKIRTISYQGKISFQSAFFRSLGFLCELALLGLPLLAVVKHPLRRAPHDRLSDTLVITNAKPAGFPSRRELFFARVSGFVLSLAIVSILFLLAFQPNSEIEPIRASVFSEQACEEVFYAVSGSLTSMVGGFLTGQVHPECLYNKSRESLWSLENMDVANFAMALATADDMELSNKYLDELCKNSSEDHLCEFSKVYLTSKEISAGQWTELISRDGQEDFVKVFAVSQLIALREFETAEQALRPMALSSIFSPIVASLSLQTLLGQMKLKQAYWVVKASEVLSLEDIIQFIEHQEKQEDANPVQLLVQLKYFFPKTGRSQGRGLASQVSLPKRVEVLYEVLEGRK